LSTQKYQCYTCISNCSNTRSKPEHVLKLLINFI
jgi:hypothetical protein